jgi:hypothetical protein
MTRRLFMNVLETKMNDSSVMILTVEENGARIEKKYSGVRCGLNLPTGSMECYYIVLAQEFLGLTRFEGKPVEQGKIVFL